MTIHFFFISTKFCNIGGKTEKAGRVTTWKLCGRPVGCSKMLSFQHSVSKKKTQKHYENSCFVVLAIKCELIDTNISKLKIAKSLRKAIYPVNAVQSHNHARQPANPSVRMPGKKLSTAHALEDIEYSYGLHWPITGGVTTLINSFLQNGWRVESVCNLCVSRCVWILVFGRYYEVLLKFITVSRG